MAESTKTFLSEHFLLRSPLAQRLYHDFAVDQPIIDYHCHLPIEDLASNRQFNNLTEIWLEGDHYKWRAMRSNGIPERYCTGDVDPREKFRAFAKTVPYTLRNPLYHWTHMELRNPFGLEVILTENTAEAVYEECNSLLQQEEFRVWPILTGRNVKVVCTTDDPVDSLEAHQALRRSNAPFSVFPAFRPDKVLAIDDSISWNAYIDQLAEAADLSIAGFNELIEALTKRARFFHENGCRLSDHGLNHMYAEEYTHSEVGEIVRKARSGHEISLSDANKVRSAILYELGLLYHQLGWTQQFHLGAMRNNSTRMIRQLGPDTGFDSIGDYAQAIPLAKYLDRLDQSGQLTRTILYNLNPADNEVFATMIGNFNDGSEPGKIQWGSAWWFLDQKDGMTKQIEALSNMGLLSRFVGMLTDSRSFLSYSRHEYFRRLLCNIFATDVENGELPADEAWLGEVIQNICSGNAERYFRFGV